MIKIAKDIISVVEHHDALRKSIVAALDSRGFYAFGVDCAEALDDEHGGRAVDVFIIDANLPGEDGLSRLCPRAWCKRPRAEPLA